MSTIVVVKKGSTVAIGGDTLTKHGYTKQSARFIENHTKLLKLGPNWIGLTGEASWALLLDHYVNQRKEPLPVFNTPAAIYAFAKDLHKVLKEEYFLNPKDDEKDEFETSQLSVGIANAHGIFGLYELRSVDQFSKFWAFGTGARVAMGAMHALYDTKRSAKEIASGALDAAVEFDDDTGAPVEIRTMKLKG